MKTILIAACFFCLTAGGCQKVPDNRFPLADSFNIDGIELTAAFNEMRKVSGALSLIVCRNEVLVAQEFYYYNNYGPDSIKNIMSVTKSFIGILTGIAIDKGFIDNVKDPIYKYLCPIIGIDDDIKRNITIEQLLKMSVGHSWNGTSPQSLFQDCFNSEDPLTYILDLPIVTEPGSVFNYSDGASHLLSAILSVATGQDLVDFAKNNLFDPMQIDEFQWARDNRNIPIGASGLRIMPYDMVKFGELILNKGRYDDVQVVSEDWINKMTSSQIITSNNVLYGPEYGYQIWLGNASGIKYYMAMGWGGQFIFILPDQEVVITASCWTSGLSWDQAGENWTRIIRIIVERIFPAIYQN